MFRALVEGGRSRYLLQFTRVLSKGNGFTRDAFPKFPYSVVYYYRLIISYTREDMSCSHHSGPFAKLPMS